MLKSMPECSELTEQDMRLTDFAFKYVYEAGNPEFHPDDIHRHVTERLEYYKHKAAKDAFLPDMSDPEQAQAVVGRIQLVSELAEADKVAAFQPHINGRQHEILDDPGGVVQQVRYATYATGIPRISRSFLGFKNNNSTCSAGTNLVVLRFGMECRKVLLVFFHIYYKI